ncbi:MAG: DNA-binding protein [Sphingobium sp.]|jgi:hypothetical protein|nr:DNA-binding protein [Sphingobium sp.]MCI1271308.1 DNA-binding protein [Sphingobium sp.]MCI2053147.1 DNA-binding protein [Sphingobium sp.]
MYDPDRMLRRADAATYLQARHGLPCAMQTLARKAVEGTGPLYHLSGRFPLYRVADLDAWAAQQLSAPRRSTSDRAAA